MNVIPGVSLNGRATGRIPGAVPARDRDVAMRYYTLEAAMRLAPDYVAGDRVEFGADLFDRAVAHHVKRKLRADIKTGQTRDVDGLHSRYSTYDWAHMYEANPDWIYYDFFSGAVRNSCDRMLRGLEP